MYGKETVKELTYILVYEGYPFKEDSNIFMNALKKIH